MDTTFAGSATAASKNSGAGRAVECTPGTRVTRSLLGYGVLAGPFYVVVSLAQAASRPGFDLRRHEWSLLANGPAGWIQVVNLIVTGLMVGAAAAGYRRALVSGVGRRSVPLLLAVFAADMVGAGICPADPMAGFPVGTPDGPPVAPSMAGLLHIAFAGIGFLAVIAATFVMAVRFAGQHHRSRSVASAVTGIVFLAGFAALASGSTAAATNLAFTAAVLLVWAWLSSTSVYLYRRVS